jgi:hypothetical protein
MNPQMMHTMPEMQGMMQEMTVVYAYNPSALLEKKTELSLTAGQVKSLENLASEVTIAWDHAKKEHDIRHARVIAEFKLAKPDPAKVKADGQEAMQDMAASVGVQLSVAARAKGLLTDAQRTKVDATMMDHPAR